MHKHKKSSNKFLIIGVIIIAILTVILINLQNQSVEEVLVEVTPVKTTPKPTPVSVTPATQYTNTRLNYSLTIPAGAYLTYTDGDTKKAVNTLPADAREVHVYTGGTYLSVSDKTYTLTSPRTQGTTIIDGRTYRSTHTPSMSAVYIKDGLTVSYGATVPTSIFASLKIR